MSKDKAITDAHETLAKEMAQLKDDPSPDNARSWIKRHVALGHAVGLYMANATKNSNPSVTFPNVDKSVHDLIHDSRVIEEYLVGGFDP